jgi:hypothetical protein
VKEQQLSKESTVYHYRLVQRVHHKITFTVMYWAIAVLYFISDLIILQPFPMILSWVLVPLLHTLLTFLYFKLKVKRPLSQWELQFFFPWIGYSPLNYIAMRTLLRLNMHLLWTSIVICCCFYPWVSLTFLTHLLFVHFWILMPRLVIFFRFRRYRESGFIKVNVADTSCYEQ